MNILLLFQTAIWSAWLIQQYDLVMQAISGSIRSLATGFFARLPYIVAGLIVLLIFWLFSKAFRWLFLTGTRRTSLDLRLRLLISRLIAVFMIVVGIFTALSVVIESFDFGQVIAGLGFTSFVVGFATKDILNNFLSGILILWQRPFHISDYVFVGTNQGKVEHIGVRATSLRKDDGEVVLIPNGEMYSSPLTIRGAGAKRRMNLKFNLGFDADVEHAKETTMDALGKTEGVVPDPRPNVYVNELNSDGVSVTVHFWIDTNESKPLKVFDRAAIAILKAFTKAEIELFPPGSLIVQRPGDGLTVLEENQNKKKGI